MNQNQQQPKKPFRIINLSSSSSVVGGDDAETPLMTVGDSSSTPTKPSPSPLKEHLIQSLDEKTKGTILRAMAVFTAIELYGSFLTGKTGEGTTKSNFITFCTSKYIATSYHQVSELLYHIFRNGVAHSYIPKGAAFLSQNPGDEPYHIKYLKDGLFIYIPKLAQDVSGAIILFYDDLKTDPVLKSNYDVVLRQLDEGGRKFYTKFINDHNIITESNINIRRGIGLDPEHG